LGFAKGLKFLVNSRTSENEHLTKNALGFVRDRFSEERLLNDMESLYMELMANRT